VTKLDTTITSFALWDSVYTTYSINPDSAVLWVNTANNLGGATRKDAFINDNADSLQAIGLSENTGYYFWCLAWDVGIADTTAVDSITTKTSPPGPQKYLMMRK